MLLSFNQWLETVVFCLYLVMLPVWNSLCLILTQVTVCFVFKCTSVSSTKTTETTPPLVKEEK